MTNKLIASLLVSTMLVLIGAATVTTLPGTIASNSKTYGYIHYK